MNQRWLLVAFIIASWTLNVALGVALYLNYRYPTGGNWSAGPSCPGGMFEASKPFPGMPPQFMMESDLREQIQTLRKQEHNWLVALAEELSRDTLDQTVVKCLADSLECVKCGLHRVHMQFLTELHGRIPPPARRELAPRLLRRLGREGGWMEPRRHGFNRFRPEPPDSPESE